MEKCPTGYGQMQEMPAMALEPLEAALSCQTKSAIYVEAV